MTSTTDNSRTTDTAARQKVAFLVAPDIEQVELTGPWEAVEQSGATPVLVSTQNGTVQAFNHLDKGDTFDVDVTVAAADVTDYAALVLPGGVANPDALRTDADAVAFVRQFVQSGKPVAAICHAPWTLIEADVVRGRTLTSWPSLQTDLRNASATWEDREVVVDDNLITSRNPDDIPAFTRELAAALTSSASTLTGRCTVVATPAAPRAWAGVAASASSPQDARMTSTNSTMMSLSPKSFGVNTSATPAP